MCIFMSLKMFTLLKTIKKFKQAVNLERLLQITCVRKALYLESTFVQKDTTVRRWSYKKTDKRAIQ